VIMPAGFAATQKKISELGYEVIPVNTSEFEKLDGGVSCMSLRF
jgi:dimethylargininase